ncbi:glycerate kinase [Leucobacter sp. W1038]|uniref:glycerate kinase n=1 Tax=Leucobacter sp. W1038 TaxID=3438281 RepID=UPI003D98AEE0
MSGSARETHPQHGVPLVVVAPDSLKGSCTAPDAARAIASGVRRALGQGVRVRELPLADGGEGTLDALVAAWGGTVLEVATTDALGRPRTGRVGLSGGRKGTRLAVIEAADANGLPAIVDQPLRPLDADTAGVGTLVRAALDTGAAEILLCLGGSATSDGGAGMLRALGARLLDASGSDVAPGARGLSELHEIDLSGLDARAGKVVWRVACDVDHLLTGGGGAAAVFGPQKGATPEQVAVIDRGLSVLLRLLAEAAGYDLSELRCLPGLGAAGGLALGPVALFGAQLVPGSALVSDAVGLPDALERAALVITAEGRLDAQSLQGKVVSRVLADAGAHRGGAHAAAGAVPSAVHSAVPSAVPVVVLAGSVELTFEECQRAGIAAAWSIARGPATLEQLQADTPRLLAEAAAHLTRLTLGKR